jgi:hypothetical protein
MYGSVALVHVDYANLIWPVFKEYIRKDIREKQHGVPLVLDIGDGYSYLQASTERLR